jgi:hypothetical protein
MFQLCLDKAQSLKPALSKVRNLTHIKRCLEQRESCLALFKEGVLFAHRPRQQVQPASSLPSEAQNHWPILWAIYCERVKRGLLCPFSAEIFEPEEEVAPYSGSAPPKLSSKTRMAEPGRQGTRGKPSSVMQTFADSPIQAIIKLLVSGGGEKTQYCRALSCNGHQQRENHRKGRTWISGQPRGSTSRHKQKRPP